MVEATGEDASLANLLSPAAIENVKEAFKIMLQHTPGWRIMLTSLYNLSWIQKPLIGLL